MGFAGLGCWGCSMVKITTNTGVLRFAQDDDGERKTATATPLAALRVAVEKNRDDGGEG